MDSTFSKGRKILIVGGVAGGGSAGARLRRLDETAEIIIFEKGPYVSFANCGLPFYVGNVISNEENLLVSNPAQFKGWFNIDVRPNHTVMSIVRDKKCIVVKDNISGESNEENYDELILSTGSKPIIPPLPGCNAPGVFQLRDIPDSNQIKSWIETRNVKSAVIVGGGFIGLEMAENLIKREITVTVVEMAPHVMPLLSDELAVILEDKMKEKGIRVLSGHGLKEIVEDNGHMEVLCGENVRVPCELVLLAIGVKPESDLARDAGLELGIRNCIKVDEHMRTSDPHIYAVGDAVQVKDYVTGQDTHVPLAGPANRQGRIVADVLCGLPSYFRGTQGTAVCGMFDLCVAMTGQTPSMLRRSKAIAEDDIGMVSIHPPNHASYYPGSSLVHLNLTFNRRTGAVLGGQAVGTEGVEKRIDVISSYIHTHGTVTDLAQAELCYAPQFGSAKDVVNMAGMIAENIVNGLVTEVSWEECFARDDVFKLDVRNVVLFTANPLPQFVNIPLGLIRGSLDRIPKEKEIFITCNVGKTAYYCCRILTQEGYNCRLLPGGWNTYNLLSKKK